jgi:predicted nuclease of predicted toxin-antitoxin system
LRYGELKDGGALISAASRVGELVVQAHDRDFRGVEEIPLDGADPPLHPLRTEGVRDLEIHLLYDIVVDFRSREVEGARA